MLTVELYRRLKSIINLNSVTFWSQSLGVAATLVDKVHVELVVEPVDKVEVVGLFPVGSLFNHSCVPNVKLGSSLSGHKVFFSAAEPIRAGDELFYQYHNHVDRKIRREELYEKYHFWCNCDLCNEEGKEEN